MPRLLCQVALVAFAAAASVPACAALRLNVTVTNKSQPNPGARVTPDRTIDTEVVLADNYISRHAGNTTVVYDFERRRYYVLDEAAKTYNEYSLFDIIGFRELELRNRGAMRKAVASANLERKLPPEIEDEHELAVQGATARTVEVREDGADELFSSEGIVLLSHGKDATPVSPGDAARFVQYLRYTFSGHPAVLAALQKEGRIPSHLRYLFQAGWGSGTIDLAIGAPRQSDAPASFTLAGYAPRALAREPVTLDDVIDRAWASRSALTAKAAPPLPEALAAQLREAQTFDAYLAVTEQQLAGAPLPLLSDEQKHSFQTDPDLQQLARALGAKTPDERRQAIATLQALRPQAGAHRYLLSLFEANDHVMLHEAPAASALYLDVLRANPAVAGAYKDIGDFYYMRFDTQHAWRSWNIARALAPLWPNLDGIEQRERALASRFPEYFDAAPSTQ